MDLRLLKRGGAVLLGITLAVNASACSSLRVDGDPFGWHSSTLSPAETRATEVEINRVYDSIWGTAQQRNAAAYLGWREMTDPIAECMEAHSLRYYRYFQPPNPADGHGPTEGWIGPLNLRPSAALRNAAAAIPRAPGGEGPAWVNTDEYAQALTICERRMGDPSRFDAPAGAEELSAKFRVILVSVDKGLGPISDYAGCMREHGIDLAAVGADGAAGLAMFLRSRMPAPPRPGEQESSLWTEYLDLEDRALSADMQCRQAKHDEAIARLAPQVDDFEEDFDHELDSIGAEWESYLDSARSIGFVDPNGVN